MLYLLIYLGGAMATAIGTAAIMSEKDGWTTGIHVLAATFWPLTMFCVLVGFAIGLGKKLKRKPK